MERFDGPIPGQSLTENPGNRPYERPPEITNVEEAIQMHLTRLSEPEKMEGILDAIEMGIDIRSLNTAYLRSAVANGIHTVDISQLVAPITHEYMKKIADEAGLDYEEGLVDEEAEQRRRDEIELAKARVKRKKGGASLQTPGEEEALQVLGEELAGGTGGNDGASGGLMKRRAK